MTVEYEDGFEDMFESERRRKEQTVDDLFDTAEDFFRDSDDEGDDDD